MKRVGVYVYVIVKLMTFSTLMYILLAAEVPDVDVMYFVLPPDELLHSKPFQYFNSSPAAHGLSFIRAITLTLITPWEQENQVRRLGSIIVLFFYSFACTFTAPSAPSAKGVLY